MIRTGSARPTRLPRRDEYERRNAYEGFECLRITYLSDGLRVVGYIWKPTATEGRKLPLIIYNIPGRSVIDMSVDTMARLYELKNIAGVKDATGNVVSMLAASGAIREGQYVAHTSGRHGLAVLEPARAGVDGDRLSRPQAPAADEGSSQTFHAFGDLPFSAVPEKIMDGRRAPGMASMTISGVRKSNWQGSPMLRLMIFLPAASAWRASPTTSRTA